jgi:biopolymer transport protein ExbB
MPGKWLAIAGGWLGLVLAAAAQEPAMQKSLAAMMLEYGGWTMKVIIALSFLVLVLTFYFLLTIRRSVVLPANFRQQAESAIEKGDLEALGVLCQEHRAAGARVLGAAAKLLAQNPQADYQLLRDTMEDEGGRQANTLWQQAQYLVDISVISPMFGLLGTVLGMIQAFVGIQGSTGIGNIRPEALASGVSKALVTTVGGLLVGIMAMMLHAYFRGRITQVVSHLEAGCSDLVHRLSQRLGAPPGGRR